MEKGIFLQRHNAPFKGRVWPNEAAFPDFFHPQASDWWGKQLTTFKYEKLWFDGLWLDMNEAANFCNGPCTDRELD